jgi:hypothetical protein
MHRSSARAVQGIVQSFGPGDRVALMPDTGGGAPPNFEYGRADWLALVDSVGANDGRSNLGQALLWARRALDTVSTGAREIYLITDGQASAWQSTALRPSDDVVYVPVARVSPTGACASTSAAFCGGALAGRPGGAANSGRTS